MRGKDAIAGQAFEDIGITPAYAGKSAASVCPVTFTRDHPRVCGEKRPEPGTGRQQEGSPPRMRGKVWCAELRRISERITPAYAGKSIVDSRNMTGNGDHPRVCGEKLECGAAGYCYLGSPPRMRGKAPPSLSSGGSLRITPAYAGKSYSSLYQ